MYFVKEVATAVSMEIIGNPVRFLAIEKWLKAYKASPNGISIQSLCIVTGPHGIGKTTRIRQIVAACNRFAIEIQPSNCHSSKDMADMIFKACNSQNLSQLFQQTQTREGSTAECGKCIIIDEFESLVANDRNIAATLATLIIKSKSLSDTPIILICESAAEKKLSELRKAKQRVTLGILDTATLFVHFSEHPDYKNFVCDADIHRACQQANGNYVYARQLLDELKAQHKSQAVVTQPVQPLRSRRKRLPPDSVTTPTATTPVLAAPVAAQVGTCAPTLYKEPTILDMFRCTSPSTLYDVFLQDAWINPMRFHENLPTELTKFRKGTKAVKEAAFVRCLEHIITWDVCMTSGARAGGGGGGGTGGGNGGGEDQDDAQWALHTLALSLHSELSKLQRKEVKEDDEEELNTFTKILSQMSLQKKNDRTWYQLCEDHGIPPNLAFNVLYSLFPK